MWVSKRGIGVCWVVSGTLIYSSACADDDSLQTDEHEFVDDTHDAGVNDDSNADDVQGDADGSAQNDAGDNAQDDADDSAQDDHVDPAEDGGAADAGGQLGPPLAPDCALQGNITSGREYGPYVLQDVRLNPNLEPGAYSFRVHSGSGGIVYVFRDEVFVEAFEYDPEMILPDRTSQEVVTLVLGELLELDLRAVTATDLSQLNKSIFDGCGAITVHAPAEIEVGEVYNGFEIVAIEAADGVTPGEYTFYAATGNAGMVELRRNGEAVQTLDYAWQTTVGGGTNFTFIFEDNVDITVTRAMGTANLFGMPLGIFDGRHSLTLP